jgi:site-specific DNA-methyltransferase (adenine-specific)
MAARVECKIGERFNVLNTIRWEKPEDNSERRHEAQLVEKGLARSWYPTGERIIFAEHYGADNMAKGEAGYHAKCDELRGFVFEPLHRYMIAEFEAARLTRQEVDHHFRTANVSQYWLQPRGFIIPTKEKYAGLQILRPQHFRREYEDLRREYEDLRREYEDLRQEYEALRRPFAVTASVPYTDVWTFPTVQAYEGKHPCEKPLALLEHIITASTRPGATVRDDFMGGGSTGVACIRTGRKFIGIEKDARYFEIARQRLENELRQGLLPLTYDNKTTVEQ